MRISDWSSDVCSSDLFIRQDLAGGDASARTQWRLYPHRASWPCSRRARQHYRSIDPDAAGPARGRGQHRENPHAVQFLGATKRYRGHGTGTPAPIRSEEHTSELQSLMRISYVVFFLNK